MCALIALVGRPNVGKSTLFNRLVGRPLALVDDRPGVTRDRNYSSISIDDHEATLIDTGGFDPTNIDPLIEQIRFQALAALEEADLTILVVDGKQGPTPHDKELANLIRRSGKKYLVAINKIDGYEKEVNLYEFHELGLENLYPVSAEHKYGMNDFKSVLIKHMSPIKSIEEEKEIIIPKVAVVGRPNAGKSSLINKLIGEERLVVDETPGTTRDAVDVMVEKDNKQYLFVDTAGVRRKGKVDEKLEKLSVMRALRSLDKADIAILVIDALEGFADQDAHIAGYAHERGRPLIILANKWDAVKNKTEIKQDIRRFLDLKLAFLENVPIINGSAKTGAKINEIYKLINQIIPQYYFRANTGELNKVMEKATTEHTPPYVGHIRLKFFYATQVSTAPPTFVVFTNRPKSVHFSYKRYLVNQFKEAFNLNLVPVKLILRPRKPGKKWAERH